MIISSSRVYKKKNDLKLLLMVSGLFLVKLCDTCLSFFFICDYCKGFASFLFFEFCMGVRKYSVGSMYNAGQRTLYALSVWQALYLAVFLLIKGVECSGIRLVV